MKPEKKFMEAVIEEAKEISNMSYPIGAVIVRDGKILSRGRSMARIQKDPTAHAEIYVIRQATKKVNSMHLNGCVLYTTLEPCPMCAATAVWSKLEGVVFGAALEDAIEYSRSIKDKDVSLSYRQINMKYHEVLDKSETKVELVGGFMRKECISLFKLSR